MALPEMSCAFALSLDVEEPEISQLQGLIDCYGMARGLYSWNLRHRGSAACNGLNLVFQGSAHHARMEQFLSNCFQ